MPNWKIMSNNIKENEEDVEHIDDIFDNEPANRPTDTSASHGTADKSSNDGTSVAETVDIGASPSNASMASPVDITQETQTESSDSKFFAIRTTGGQENIVANMVQNRVNSKRIGIYSIMILDNFKGYILVEAPDSNIAYEALAGVRHVRGQIRGELPFKDVEGYLVKKPVVSELNVDDTVEIIGGPFKAMKAKITRVDYEKQEATVVLLDSPYQIPVTVDANYLKKVAH